MKVKKNARFDDFVLSFQEIWRFDKRLLFVLIAAVIINAALPFPNIILSGLIVDTIVKGEDFFIVIFYVTLMFGLNFFLTAVNTYIGKEREFLFIKFINKLNNDISHKCMNTDFEQFNDPYFQDRIVLIKALANGNNFFTNIMTLFETVSRIITLIGIILIMTILNAWLLVFMLVVVGLQSVLHIKQLNDNKQYQYDIINDQRKLGYVSQLAREPEAKKDIDMFGMHAFVSKKIELLQRNLLEFDKCRIKKNGFAEMTTSFLSVAFQISAYILLALNVFAGKISIGDFTMGVASLINFLLWRRE